MTHIFFSCFFFFCCVRVRVVYSSDKNNSENNQISFLFYYFYLSRYKNFRFDSRSPRQQNSKLIRFFVPSRDTFFYKPYFIFIFDLNEFDLWLCLHSQQMNKIKPFHSCSRLFPSLFNRNFPMHDTNDVKLYHIS